MLSFVKKKAKQGSNKDAPDIVDAPESTKQKPIAP